MRENQQMSSLREEFLATGYLVVEDVLTSTDIDRLVGDYAALLNRLAPAWHAQGKIPSTFESLPFDQRIGAILSQSAENLFGHFDISLPNADIDSDTPIHLSRPVFDMIKSPRILDVIEQLIGSEIYASPIQHVRIKPPQRAAEQNKSQSSLATTTGWHQDQGVAPRRVRRNRDDHCLVCHHRRDD